MDQFNEFFSNIFEHDLWPPRWHCGYWSAFHGWLYILSDLSIWGAYFMIPAIILRYISKKHQVRFHKAYIYFAAFILACGLTHLVDAAMFWVPMYRFNALVRLITAIVSWLTIYHLIKMLPIAFSLKNPEQLEAEVARSAALLEELEKSNAELKKQNEFIENVFNATLDHINVFDIQLNLISVNAKTEKLLNKSRGELIGKNFSELFPEAVGKAYHLDLKAAAQGEVIKNKTMKSLANRYYDTSFIPLYENGRQYAVLAISKEMTEVIEKGRALEKLNGDLNRQNDRLGLANAELENFTYILSHDLQEPLRKIQSYYSLIDLPGLPDLQQSYLRKIDESATRMRSLIRNVLDYARADKSRDAMQPVNLNEVLKDVLLDLELYIHEKKALVTSVELPWVLGVKYQLDQVFYNLIVNAIKYNRHPPLIDISCTTQVIQEAGKEVRYRRISFKDNGIGFDEQFAQEIFVPFRRLENKEEYAGTGIGLALVKRIMEAHHGSVTAESNIGAGSVFTLIFPAVEAPGRMNAI